MTDSKLQSTEFYSRLNSHCVGQELIILDPVTVRLGTKDGPVEEELSPT